MENVLKSLLLSSTSTADSSDFFKADEEDVHPQHSSPPLSSLTSFTRLDIGLNRLMRLAAIVAPPASSSTTEVPSLQGGCLAVIPDPFSHVRNHPLIFNNLSWHSIHRTLITGNLNSILLMSPLTPSSLDTNTRLIVEALLLLLIYLARQFGIRDAGNQIDAMITGILTKELPRAGRLLFPVDFWQATFIDNNLRLAVTRDDRDKIKPLNLSINKVLESIRLSHLRKSGTLFLSAIPSESSSPSTSSSDPFGSSPSSFISSHFDTKSVSPVMPSRYTLYSDYTLINLSKILKTSYDTVFQFQGVDQFMCMENLQILARHSTQIPISWFSPTFIQIILIEMEKSYSKWKRLCASSTTIYNTTDSHLSHKLLQNIEIMTRNVYSGISLLRCWVEKIDLQSETSKAYFQKQLSLIFLISTEIMADSTLTSSITPTSSSTPFAAAGTHHLHSTGTHIHTMKCHILFHCISYLSPAVLRFQQVQQEPLSFDLGPVLPTRLQILSIISSAFARISTDVSVQDREFLYSRLVSVFQCCNLTDDSSEYTKSIVGAFIAICIQSFDLSIYSEEVKPTTATSQNEVFVDDGGEDIEANETTKEGASSSTSSLPPPPILVAPRKQSYLAFREGARIRVFFRAVFDRWWSLADAEMLMTILQEQLALGPSPPRHIAAFNIGCLFVVLGMMDSLYAKRVALRAIKFVGSDATIIKYRQRRALIKQLERTLIPKADNIFLLCLKILVRRTDVDEILDSAQSLFETVKLSIAYLTSEWLQQPRIIDEKGQAVIERDFSDCLVLFDLETSARIMECMYSTVYEIDAGLALWSLFSFQQLGMAVYNAFLESEPVKILSQNPLNEYIHLKIMSKDSQHPIFINLPRIARSLAGITRFFCDLGIYDPVLHIFSKISLFSSELMKDWKKSYFSSKLPATGKYSDAYWKYLRTCLFVNVLAFQGFADHCEESRGRVVPALLKRIEARYQHGPSDDKFIQSLKISAAATTTSVSVQSKFDLTQHIFESLSSLHFITIRFGREGFRAWQYVLACSLSWMVRTTDATGLQVGRASGGKKKYSPMIDGIVVKVARNWLDHLEADVPPSDVTKSMLVFSLLTTWQIIRFVRPETIVNYFLPAIRSYLVCHPSFAAVSSAGGELGYSNNTLEPQQAVALETVKSEAFRPVDKQILGSNNITIDKSKPGMNVDLEVFDAAQSFSMSMLGNVASFRGIVKWFAGWYANCLLDMFPQQVEVHLLRRGFSQSVRSLSYLISPQRTVASIPSVQSPSSSPSIHTSSEEMNDHDQRPIKSIIPSSSPSSSAFHGTDGQQESAVVVMESEDGGSSNDSAISTIQIDRTDINSISNSSESSLLPSSSSTTPTNADGSDDAVSTATPTSFQLNYSTMERIEQQGDELAWKCIENLGDRIVAELSSHKTFFTPLVRNDPPTTPSLSLSPVSQQSVSDQLTIVLIDQIRTVSLLRLQQLLNLIESILLYADIEPHNNTTVNTSNTIASPAPSPPPTTVNSNPFVWSSLYDTIANPHGFDYTKKNTCISWWLHLVSKAKQLDPPIQSANSALEQMPAKL